MRFPNSAFHSFKWPTETITALMHFFFYMMEQCSDSYILKNHRQIENTLQTTGDIRLIFGLRVDHISTNGPIIAIVKFLRLKNMSPKGLEKVYTRIRKNGQYHWPEKVNCKSPQWCHLDTANTSYSRHKNPVNSPSSLC